MNEQQRYLLGLLLEIHDICVRNGIRYSLAGGTLIGAIRHGGFLPWDDDADVYMTRANWNRFEAACNHGALPENRILQSPSDPSYTNTFPRYTSLDTVAIHAHQALNDTFEGEVIDIFVLDPIENKDEVIDAYTYDLMLYSDLVNYAGVYGRRFGVSVDDYERYRRLQAEKGEAYIRELFENKLASYVKEDGGIYAMRWGGYPLLFERAWFDTYREVPFEGHMLLSGAGLDEYLTMHYGDEWYEVPSMANHAGHDAASSLLITAKEAEGMCLVEGRIQMKERLSSRKASMLRSAKRDYDAVDEIRACEGSLLVRDTISRYNDSAGTLHDDYRSEDLPTYEAIYEHYVDWQLSRKVAGRDDWRGVHRYKNPLLATLPVEIHRRLLAYLLNSEQTYKAYRLLEICEHHRELDSFEQDVRKTVLTLREARIKLQYGDAARAYSQAASVLDNMPCNKSALKIAVNALIEQGGNALAKAEELCRRARNLYPQDGGFSAYLARIQTIQGGNPSAIQELYDHAVEHTHDGLVLYFVRQRAACDSSTKRIADLALAGSQPAQAGERPAAFAREVLAVYEGLLGDVLTLCNQAGVRAFANPLQAIRIEVGQSPVQANSNANVVFMKGDDLAKLVAFVEADPQRLPADLALEYMGNNPAYKHQTVSFYNTQTTDLSSRSSPNYLHHGMFLAIHPLTPAKRSLLIGAQRSLWRNSSSDWDCMRYDRSDNRNPKRRLRRGRSLFMRTMKSFSKKTQGYSIRVCNKVFHPSASLFENTQDVQLENGAHISIPINVQAYTQEARALIDKREGTWPKPLDFWCVSPRVAAQDDEVASYREALKTHKMLMREQRVERKTRRKFNSLFSWQKQVIAKEDELRRAARTMSENANEDG